MLAVLYPSSHNEPELLHRLNQGDEGAFREVFESLYRPLCFFARKLIEQREEAEDITSQAFHKLWVKSPHFKSFGALRSYMYTAVRNQCLDLLKHKGVVQAARKQVLLAQEEAEDYIESRMMEAELLQLIYQEMENLPVKFRKILHLSYIEELPTSEIAGQLDMSESHVRADRSRAIAQLRSLVAQRQIIGVTLLLWNL